MDKANNPPNKAFKLILHIICFILACIVVINAELSLIADTCNQSMSDSFQGIVFSVIIWAVLIALNLKSKSYLNFWISLLLPSCYFIAVLPRSIAVFNHVVMNNQNICTINMMMVEGRIDTADLVGGFCWLFLSLTAIYIFALGLRRLLAWGKNNIANIKKRFSKC
ncbi:hypothetical protein [Bartonella sp. HY038]|uniref:hypothetical protein n=1 Tax=Bartonella sp. HY038 TaxID=2759660 RepID=UPI0015FD34C3|nr:hypothetical protein [Bartonella sp. HY038]